MSSVQPETAGGATTSLRLWLISSFFRPLSPFFPPLGWVRRARAVAREGAGEEARRRESWWDEGVTRAGVSTDCFLRLLRILSSRRYSRTQDSSIPDCFGGYFEGQYGFRWRHVIEFGALRRTLHLSDAPVVLLFAIVVMATFTTLSLAVDGTVAILSETLRFSITKSDYTEKAS